jgi:hypothetical protein
VVEQVDGFKEVSPAGSEVPIPTVGKVFTSGAFIELADLGNSTRPGLLLWDGSDHTAGAVIEYRGQLYKPCAIHESVMRELNLPTRAGTFKSVRALLAEICNLIEQFTGLSKKSTALIARFVLVTWLVDAMPIAPRILIEGPDIARANQLVLLLRCICRRALPMTEVSSAGLCTLPSGMCFTLLVRQASISSTLANVLEATIVQGNPLLRAGKLVNIFGAQAILCDSGNGMQTLRAASIRIPCMPTGGRLLFLNDEQQRQIVEEFQPKLLAFRFSHYKAAREARFDASQFAPPLRDLADVLAAATPGDEVLQAELFELLAEENSEIKAANWVDLNTVIIEAILVHCREAKNDSVYVGAIAAMAQQILHGRDENRKIDPGEAGRRIKALGFSTLPRDAQGIRLSLTNEACVRVHDLAHQFEVPGVQKCECKNAGYVGQID